MRRLLAFVAAGTLLLASGGARADEPPPSQDTELPPPPPPPDGVAPWAAPGAEPPPAPPPEPRREPLRPIVSTFSYDSDRDEVAAPKTEKRWYGWQGIVVDGGVGALTAFFASSNTRATDALMFGAIGHMLGGPIVHWMHGNAGKGFASFGIRAGTTFVAGAAGASNDKDIHLVGVVAIAAGVIVDWAVLSRDEVPVKQPTLAPTGGLMPGGAFVGAGGTF